MPTDPNFVTTPQKIRVYTLHNETVFDADAELLDGVTLTVPEFDAVWVWFTPADSYDGVAHFEISPDGGVTWFAAQGVESADLSTFVASVTAPVTGDSYLIYVPTWSMFRVRMADGSVGSLSVFARLTNFNFGRAS